MRKTSNFIHKIQHINPMKREYVKYWREIKKRCIEGYWSDGYYMPGNLYFYGNLGRILMNVNGAKTKSVGIPDIRDVEWKKAYIFTEAKGFSGFELDDKFTCSRWVDEINKAPEKSEDPSLFNKQELIKDYIRRKKIKPFDLLNPCYDNDGNAYIPQDESFVPQFKEYVPAREYLPRKHKKNLGKPLYYNNAKNVFDLEARRMGKSYFAAVGLILHNFLFDGATDYDAYLDAQSSGFPLSSETLVGAIDAKYTKDLLSKVQLSMDNLPGAKNWNGKDYPSPIGKQTKGTFAIGKYMEAAYDVKTSGGWTTKGSKSKIHNRSFADNPLAGNGTGPNLVVLEEVGFMNNLKSALGAMKDATYDGTDKFGVIWMCVCAGTKVWTKNGKLINIEDLKQDDGILGYNFESNDRSIETISYMQAPKDKSCVRIKLEDRELECSYDHPIAVACGIFKDAEELKTGDEVLVVNNDLSDISPNDDTWYEKRTVVSVTDIGIKGVYNLTADVTNTYMANGIITHNTGTGGEGDSAAISQPKDVFFNPEAYDCLVFEDEWENSPNGIGYFVPYHYRLDDYRDSEGNIDLSSASVFIDKKRLALLKQKDKKAYYDEVQNNPITPSEAFLVDNKNIFPTAELKAHLQWLKSSEDGFAQGQCGELIWEKDNPVPVWHPDLKNKLQPCGFRMTPDMDTTGCIQIWEHPTRTNGQIPYGLYIAGTDPYDQDHAPSSVSLGSTIIYKTFDPNTPGISHYPVAEYTARPSTAKEHHETVRKLLIYYGATCLYENERNTIKFHFEQKNSLHLLARTPTVLKATEGSKINRQYGTHMTAQIKSEIEIYLRDWLEEESEDGNLNLHKIYSIPLLEELINYNDHDNFDRVIAMMLVIVQKMQNHRIKVADAKESKKIDNFLSRLGKFYR